MPKKLIVVLSMHRSGSSLTTKALSVLGASLGAKLNPASPGNVKGHWEDLGLVALNNKMLQHLGFRWYSLRRIGDRECQELQAAGFERVAGEYLAGLQERSDPVVIKDPRMSKLLRFWMPILKRADFDLRFVIPLRDPEKVADSLLRRDKMLIRHGRHLWFDYMMSILSHLDRRRCCLVEFDRLISAPKSELARMSKELGLTADPKKIAAFASDFVSPELDGSKLGSTPQVYDDVADQIYDILSRKGLGAADIEENFTQWQSHWDNVQPGHEMADALMQIARRGPDPYLLENRNFRNMTGWQRWPALFLWLWRQTIRRLRTLLKGGY